MTQRELKACGSEKVWKVHVSQVQWIWVFFHLGNSGNIINLQSFSHNFVSHCSLKKWGIQIIRILGVLSHINSPIAGKKTLLQSSAAEINIFFNKYQIGHKKNSVSITSLHENDQFGISMSHNLCYHILIRLSNSIIHRK